MIKHPPTIAAPAFQAAQPTVGYPIAMTSCIAASCRFGSEYAIVLCADRRIDYGTCNAANENAWKISVAGPGWMALMAGPTSRCNALLSLFWRHLIDTPPLTEENVWKEMQAPLDQYKESLRSHSFPKGKPIELLLTGFIDKVPYIFKIATSDAERDEVSIEEDFACIGSGSYLAHASFMNRTTPNGNIQIDEILYYVYEAKRWSELETGVNKKTSILIQRAGEAAPDSMILDNLKSGALNKLAQMYKRFGPQPYDASTVDLDKILYVNPQA